MVFGSRQWRLVVSTAVLLAVPGCPKPTPVEVVTPPGGDPTQLPPAIPAEVKLVQVDPMDAHDPSARSPLLDIMAAENKRWMAKLKAQREPGYFVSYQIADRHQIAIEAEEGSLTVDADESGRALDVEVRVGSPRMDNRRPINDPAARADTRRLGKVPFGADKQAIAQALWLETDRRYRESRDLFRLVRAQERVISSSEPTPADFSHEKRERFIHKPKTLSVDKKRWAERMRACSRRANAGVATRGTCRVDFEATTTYYIDSDGSQIQNSSTSARIMVSVGVKADDGMPIGRLEQRFATKASDLPSDGEINRMIAVVNKDLDALHAAPVVDPYVGPAVLEGRAAAVFFHEVFGHRVEGHRQKGNISGQTFSNQVGKRIMPEWLTVYDDPTVMHLNGMYLNGFYRF